MIATSSVTFCAPVLIRIAQNVVFATYARLGVLRLFQMKNWSNPINIGRFKEKGEPCRCSTNFLRKRINEVSSLVQKSILVK